MSTPTLTLYGIKNCDTVRKARKWLDAHAIEYRFHDFKTDTLHEQTYAAWRKEHDVFTIVNKRSTTWKKLTEQEQDAITNESDFSVIQQHLSLIKRPVLDNQATQIFGFKEETYSTFVASL